MKKLFKILIPMLVLATLLISACAGVLIRNLGKLIGQFTGSHPTLNRGS